MKTKIFIIILLGFFLSGCGMFDFLDAEMNKAIKKKDPKLCLKMTEDEARKERCLAAVAEAKEDAGVCDLIEDGDRKDKCFSGVAVKKEDPAICERVSGESRKSTCYSRIAVNTRNENLCEKIPNKRTQGSCYGDIAKEKNDESICSKIVDSYSGPRCYMEIAKSKKDTSICNKIEGRASLVSQCLSGVAEASGDQSICASIETSSYRDNCYLSLGIKKSDRSICDKIGSETKKNNCISRLDKSAEEKEAENGEEEEEEKYGVIEKDGNLYINSKPGEVLSIATEDLPVWARGQIAGIGAKIAVTGPPDSIIEGDEYVLLDGIPVARVGDATAHGGQVTTGSEKIFINGKPAAIFGGWAVDPMITGQVPNVGGPIVQ